MCELDLIFHADAVHHILAELVMGGMVLQTSMTEILARIEEQNKLVKMEAGISAAPARAVSAVKNMNIPQQIKDMKLPDLPQAIKDLKFWPDAGGVAAGGIGMEGVPGDVLKGQKYSWEGFTPVSRFFFLNENNYFYAYNIFIQWNDTMVITMRSKKVRAQVDVL